jgi:hypothetical protein
LYIRIWQISASGGNVKVTAYVAGRWVKAAFLVVLGIVILIYSNGLVEDLRSMMEDELEVAFESVWDLLMILLWILVAWLFVLAALNIAFSIQESKYSIQEVMRRLDRIDRKLGIKPSRERREEVEDLEEEEELEPRPQKPVVEEDIPPPPKE